MVFNHSKTWQFSVAAEPAACAQAFRKAMTSSPGVKLRAVKWNLSETSVALSPGETAVAAIVATYVERAGLAKLNTGLFGDRAEAAEARAIGSEVTFAYQSGGTGRSECSMWLSRSGKTLGLTADAGYIRGYMNSVEKALRQLDSSMSVQRG